MHKRLQHQEAWVAGGLNGGMPERQREVPFIKVPIADVEALPTFRGSVAQGPRLFRPGFDSPDAHNPKGSVEPALRGAAEEIQRTTDHDRAGHSFYIDENNAGAVFEVKTDDIAEIFVGGEQNPGRPKRVAEDGIIIGLCQTNLGGPFDIQTLAPQCLHQIGMYAMICEEAHAVLLRGAGLVENVGRFFCEIRRKFQSRQNIFFSNARELSGDIVNGITGGKEIQNIHNGDAGTADARFAETDTGINGNSIHRGQYTIVNNFGLNDPSDQIRWGYHLLSPGMWHIMD